MMEILKLPEGKSICRKCIYCLDIMVCELRPLDQDYVTGRITYENCRDINMEGDCDKFEEED